MSTWQEDRRANQAAEAEQRRRDKDAAAERQLRMRAAEDERRRTNRSADQAAERAEKLQQRKDRRDRRKERAQAWAKNTTPINVYRRGTLALVTVSALASLPAQVAYFAGISLMLLPVPFALEGAAWVMAAGVAYADEAKLPGWVRWLLRGLSMSAAGYAAHVNYLHGARQGSVVGWGLAAVTMLGPLFFEVRQWVSTLSAPTKSGAGRAEAKARRKHDRKRRWHHRDVRRVADRLMSAAAFGTLTAEDAWAQAWAIINGTRTPGMTPALHAAAAASQKALETALTDSGMTPEAAAVELFLADVFGPGRGDDGTDGGTAPGGPESGPRGGGDGNGQGSTRGRSQGQFSLGGKGKQGSGRTARKAAEKPLAEEDLAKVRDLAQRLGGAANLSHSLVRKAVGGGANEYLVRLRKAVQTEQSEDH